MLAGGKGLGYETRFEQEIRVVSDNFASLVSNKIGHLESFGQGTTQFCRRPSRINGACGFISRSIVKIAKYFDLNHMGFGNSRMKSPFLRGKKTH